MGRCLFVCLFGVRDRAACTAALCSPPPAPSAAGSCPVCMWNARVASSMACMLQPRCLAYASRLPTPPPIIPPTALSPAPPPPPISPLLPPTTHCLSPVVIEGPSFRAVSPTLASVACATHPHRLSLEEPSSVSKPVADSESWLRSWGWKKMVGVGVSGECPSASEESATYIAKQRAWGPAVSVELTRFRQRVLRLYTTRTPHVPLTPHTRMPSSRHVLCHPTCSLVPSHPNNARVPNPTLSSPPLLCPPFLRGG